MLGDLPGEFDLAVKLHVQNIPEMIRDQLVDALTGDDSSESVDAVAQFRSQAAAWQGKLLSAMMTESDTLTVGLTMDQEGKKIVADIFATPLPDTDLAAHVADLAEVKTRFGKLRDSDGATITLGVTETLHPVLGRGNERLVPVVSGGGRPDHRRVRRSQVGRRAPDLQ